VLLLVASVLTEPEQFADPIHYQPVVAVGAAHASQPIVVRFTLREWKVLSAGRILAMAVRQFAEFYPHLVIGGTAENYAASALHFDIGLALDHHCAFS
jgi:hypothetical protein